MGHVTSWFADLIDWRPKDLAIVGNIVLVYSKYDSTAIERSEFSVFALFVITDESLLRVIAVMVGVSFPAF